VEKPLLFRAGPPAPSRLARIVHRCDAVYRKLENEVSSRPEKIAKSLLEKRSHCESRALPPKRVPSQKAPNTWTCQLQQARLRDRPRRQEPKNLNIYPCSHSCGVISHFVFDPIPRHIRHLATIAVTAPSTVGEFRGFRKRLWRGARSVFCRFSSGLKIAAADRSRGRDCAQRRPARGHWLPRHSRPHFV
jgi:hypothetical protein